MDTYGRPGTFAGTRATSCSLCNKGLLCIDLVLDGETFAVCGSCGSEFFQRLLCVDHACDALSRMVDTMIIASENRGDKE